MLLQRQRLSHLILFLEMAQLLPYVHHELNVQNIIADRQLAQLSNARLVVCVVTFLDKETFV